MDLTNSDVLIVVDMQNDFCEGGALPTADGHAVVPVINEVGNRFQNVALTQDWHPKGHVSFASAHPGKAPLETIPMPYGDQILWPDHVVQNTWGAEFHPDLNLPHAQLIIRKGYLKDVDSYSAFCMVDGVTKTGLASYLSERGISRVFVAGCAIDYCVGGLATDAVKSGFETFIIDDATASIDPAPGASADCAWKDVAAAGVTRINSADLA
ncbi:MAG: nicotinamidase [Rhodobacteraceae bacterium]|nr:nicotinamidase [Paracoccaceae bacterium]